MKYRPSSFRSRRSVRNRIYVCFNYRDDSSWWVPQASFLQEGKFREFSRGSIGTTRAEANFVSRGTQAR